MACSIDSNGFRVSSDNFATMKGSLRAFSDRSAEVIVLERRPQELDENGFGIQRPDIFIFDPSNLDMEEIGPMIFNTIDIAKSTYIINAKTMEKRKFAEMRKGINFVRQSSQKIALSVVENLASEGWLKP